MFSITFAGPAAGTRNAEAIRQGGLLRDAGVFRATLNRRDMIDREELRFLDFLATNGPGTMDDAVDDLTAKFNDGGKWRGSIPLRLAREGLIQQTGVTRSCRKHRHRGWLAVWAILDGHAVEDRRVMLRTILAALDAIRDTTGPMSAVVEPIKS